MQFALLVIGICCLGAGQAGLKSLLVDPCLHPRLARNAEMVCMDRGGGLAKSLHALGVPGRGGVPAVQHCLRHVLGNTKDKVKEVTKEASYAKFVAAYVPG